MQPLTALSVNFFKSVFFHCQTIRPKNQVKRFRLLRGRSRNALKSTERTLPKKKRRLAATKEGKLSVKRFSECEYIHMKLYKAKNPTNVTLQLCQKATNDGKRFPPAGTQQQIKIPFSKPRTTIQVCVTWSNAIYRPIKRWAAAAEWIAFCDGWWWMHARLLHNWKLKQKKLRWFFVVTPALLGALTNARASCNQETFQCVVQWIISRQKDKRWKRFKSKEERAKNRWNFAFVWKCFLAVSSTTNHTMMAQHLNNIWDILKITAQPVFGFLLTR